jgi:hypothetical protein
MIKSPQLRTAKALIARRFIAQCNDGPQVKGLPAGTKACGQFADERVSSQRGFHGTAGAIRVLGEEGRTDSRAREIIPGLIQYVERRASIEQELCANNHLPSLKEQLERDDANVIKLSELLFALSFVDVAVSDTEALRNLLAGRLCANMVNSSGWGYFLAKSDVEPQLLPTAHAVRALAEHGYPVDQPIEFLRSALTAKSSNGKTKRADISVHVFCLYVLSFIKNPERVERRESRKEFLSLWRRLDTLLTDDIEQNIEYSRDDEHYYVRVPWQLYLLALASKLAPWRRFASRTAQLRLKSILEDVSSTEGFFYPHSGLRVSSRTNAVLYDVLSIIEGQLTHRWELLLTPAHLVDLIRTFLSSTWVKRFARLIALVLVAVSTYSWYHRGGHLAELAPELLAAIILLFVSGGKAR